MGWVSDHKEHLPLEVFQSTSKDRLEKKPQLARQAIYFPSGVGTCWGFPEWTVEGEGRIFLPDLLALVI